jgi:hypothetical protein
MNLIPPNTHICQACSETFRSFEPWCLYCYSCIKKEQEQKAKLHAIYEYLTREVLLGKTEFRIAFQTEKRFIVHPLNKDGDTFDGELI